MKLVGRRFHPDLFQPALLGKIARGLIETLRKGANPLDDRMLMVAKAHLAALVALHAKDVRGEGGPAGVAVMAKLASIHA